MKNVSTCLNKIIKSFCISRGAFEPVAGSEQPVMPELDFHSRSSRRRSPSRSKYHSVSQTHNLKSEMKPQTNRPKPLCGGQSSLETIQREQNFVLFIILIHYCLRQFIMCVARAIVGFFSFQFAKGAEKCKALLPLYGFSILFHFYLPNRRRPAM